MTEEQSFRNQLLVSLPSLKGDYFQNTVSLLVDHNENGAFGLVINRPVNTTLGELFPAVGSNFDCPVLEGGPVEQNRVFFLHSGGREFESSFKVSEEIRLTTSPDFIELMAAGQAPPRSLAILGYAGWGSGQLEREIAEDVWLLAPCDPRIVFDTPFPERTKAAARLLGIDLNLILPSPGHD